MNGNASLQFLAWVYALFSVYNLTHCVDELYFSKVSPLAFSSYL